MSRIAATFERLAAADRTALVTYLVGGDPEPAATVPAMHALVAAGADLIELGIPFSDPEAEGPDIQLGCERALAHGTRLVDLMAMVTEFRSTDPDTPIVLMGYLNSVERMGHERFADLAATAGVDGLILVNLPPEEAGPMRAVLRERAIDLIFLLSPTTTDARARLILGQASGFAYYVSLKGTTGAGNLDVDEVEARIGALRALTTLPLAVGFGIRGGEAARAVGRFADAVVVGSAVVRCMGELGGATDRIPAALGELVGELRQAMDARD
ncbi:MAG TPA: tryptophan synthase subunit alpha [Pseudomonadales bacterium]|nr:tryptophan synthase subunit alpha [Pseudomonadales bacterium]